MRNSIGCSYHFKGRKPSIKQLLFRKLTSGFGKSLDVVRCLDYIAVSEDEVSGG
jgi:hypothetical protein